MTIDDNRGYPEQDQVYLTSTLSGVNEDDIKYYWWLRDETNSPLYTYSVSVENQLILVSLIFLY